MRNALEHFSQVDTASFFAKTLPPCWNRTILLPFLIMKMERGEGVPHLELLLEGLAAEQALLHNINESWFEFETAISDVRLQFSSDIATGQS
jgi:hypothetical protein